MVHLHRPSKITSYLQVTKLKRSSAFFIFFCLLLEESGAGSVQILPDPGDPKTYGSYGSGPCTLIYSKPNIYILRKARNFFEVKGCHVTDLDDWSSSWVGSPPSPPRDYRPDLSCVQALCGQAMLRCNQLEIFRKKFIFYILRQTRLVMGTYCYRRFHFSVCV